MSEYIYTSNGEPLANERGEILLARAGKIVRCRDCEYYEDYTGCCTRRDNIAPMAATPDGFCAWGERQEMK